MKTLSAEEYRKKYGTESYTNLLKASPQAQQSQQPGFFKQIGNAFSSGVNQIKEGLTAPVKSPLQGAENAFKTLSGAVNTVSSPLAPVFKPVGDAVNAYADRVSNNPTVQKFANSKAGQITSRVAEDVGNVANVAGVVAGGFEAPKLAEGAGDLVNRTSSRVGEMAGPLKSAIRDVTPTKEGYINHSVTKALDLTAGDVKNISMSTGNEVGRFMADKNLIGVNKAATVSNLENFFKENHATVRSEIGNVLKDYKPSTVPRYVEALKAIQSKVEGTPGLQKASVEIENLLNKKSLKLMDVQRVKELIDEHFNLYKATGDVGEGVAKQGLDNIRKDLRGFIEEEVKNTTGQDIGEMNNNVATSKGILNAVEERSTAGLTRANLKMGDLGTFGIGSFFGGPLIGAAAVFVKKLFESPSVQLRISKFLDGISDAEKASIQAELKAGKIPDQFQQFVKKGHGGPGAMAVGDLERIDKPIQGSMSIGNLKVHEGAPDVSRIEMYKNNLEAKQPVDRIKVIREKGGYGVEDGKHRLAAYKELGYDRVPVEIIKKSSRYTKGSDGKFTGSAIKSRSPR